VNEIRDGWRHPDLHVAGILLTKMDTRIKGHIQMVENLKAHPVLGKRLCGVIPANEAVAYAHSQHLSVFEYDPHCTASRAYAQLVAGRAKQLVAQRGVA
jgi:chromosome partitioning protein